MWYFLAFYKTIRFKSRDKVSTIILLSGVIYPICIEISSIKISFLLIFQVSLLNVYLFFCFSIPFYVCLIFCFIWFCEERCVWKETRDKTKLRQHFCLPFSLLFLQPRNTNRNTRFLAIFNPQYSGYS